MSTVRQSLLSPEDKSEKKAPESGCCSCSAQWVKTFLIFFLCIAFLIAIGLTVLGGYMIFVKYPELAMLVGDVVHICHFMIFVLACLLVISCIVGFIAIAKENMCMLNTFSFIMAVVLVLQVATAVGAVLLHEPAKVWIAEKMKGTMQTMYGSGDKEINKAVDRVHEQFKCCASYGFRDWEKSKFVVSKASMKIPENLISLQDTDKKLLATPDSCCLRNFKECGRLVHPSNIFTRGCIDSVFKSTQDQLFIIFVVLFSLLIVEFMALILANCYKAAYRHKQRAREANYK